MVQIKELQPHIQLTDAVDTDCAAVVGDPARCGRSGEIFG